MRPGGGFDEVKRCPELLPAIKQSVDAGRRPGRFTLSGSANLSLLGHVSETLAGRATYFTLHPMTRREIRRRTGMPPFRTGFLRTLELPRGAAEPGVPPVSSDGQDAHATPSDPRFAGWKPALLSDDSRRTSRYPHCCAIFCRNHFWSFYIFRAAEGDPATLTVLCCAALLGGRDIPAGVSRPLILCTFSRHCSLGGGDIPAGRFREAASAGFAATGVARKM